MRRHVYTLTKIACENSIALPKFLSALVMCVSMLYVKRLRGEDEWGRSKTTVGYCRT